MTQQSEWNKAIAVFDGYTYYPDGFYESPYNYYIPCFVKELNPVGGMKRYKVLTDLKYHTSFDWLMPVVQKIRSLWNEESLDLQLLEENDDASKIKHLMVWAEITSVYEAVIQFIQWYNSINKTTCQ